MADNTYTANFYPTGYYPTYALHDYEASLDAIKHGHDVHTTQMALLDEAKHYDLIRIVYESDVIEIRNTHDGFFDCSRTQRQLRRAHKLYHLWRSGEFEVMMDDQ